jgi:hypothetical protein
LSLLSIPSSAGQPFGAPTGTNQQAWDAVVNNGRLSKNTQLRTEATDLRSAKSSASFDAAFVKIQTICQGLNQKALLPGFEPRLEKIVCNAFTYFVEFGARHNSASAGAMGSLMTVYGKLSSNKLFGLEAQAFPILYDGNPASKSTRSTFAAFEAQCLLNP